MNKLRFQLTAAVLFLLLCGLSIIGLLQGDQVFAASFLVHLFELDSPDTAVFLLNEVRLPRVLLALLAGSALGVAGVLLQDSLQNPLADPGLLGIAQGASFIMAVALIHPGVLPDWPLPILCLIAGFIAGALVIFSCGKYTTPIRMILAGAICSGFLGVASSALVLLAPVNGNGLAELMRFTTGTLSGSYWDSFNSTLPWILVAGILALLCGRTLNLLSLGDEIASSNGLNPKKARLLLLFVAMLLLSPVFASVGPISFVALFAPHIARSLLVSSNAYPVLIISGLLGAALLLAADLLGRLLLFPMELPAGLWTIVIIGPLALALVGQKVKA